MELFLNIYQVACVQLLPPLGKNLSPIFSEGRGQLYTEYDQLAVKRRKSFKSICKVVAV